MVAVSALRPELIEGMFEEHGDGSLSVRLFEQTGSSSDDNGGYTPRVQIIDRDLYVSPTGALLYAAGSKRGGTSGALWPALLEKAYMTQYEDGYQTFGHRKSRMPLFQTLSALTGAPADWSNYGSCETEEKRQRIGAEIKKAIDKRWPICAGTGTREPDRYQKNGFVPDHVYAILDYEEKDGALRIQVRNPWGLFEPAGPVWRRMGSWLSRKKTRAADGEDDGTFWLPLEEFTRWFTSITWVTVS